METPAAASIPDRPGTARAAGKQGAKQSQPGGSNRRPQVGIGTLDNVRAVFWHSYRHLFPPHALAAQTPNGSVVISWSITDDPQARYPYAAPVMLRFDESLMDTMWKAELPQRVRLARKHEPLLREGLRGYDPFARFPNARVVVIG